MPEETACVPVRHCSSARQAGRHPGGRLTDGEDSWAEGMRAEGMRAEGDCRRGDYFGERLEVGGRM